MELVNRLDYGSVVPRAGSFRDASEPRAVWTQHTTVLEFAPSYDARNRSLVLFDRGDEILVQTGPEGVRFLLVSEKPIEERVAWYGPIVMNYPGQLEQAMAELQEGTFIKHR
jgi:redox-sensitive bicupin YhaK (pirin superfamily)